MSTHNTSANRLALLERRKNVARRYLRGETQWEIARAFEVNQSTISDDLAAIRVEWLGIAVLDMDAIKAKELARIDEVERQAWAAWTKSQENAETLKDRTSGNTSMTEKVSKGQAGDPRFLDVVLKCVERRCKILGVEESRPPSANDYTDATDDDRRTILQRGLARLGLRVVGANGDGQATA